MVRGILGHFSYPCPAPWLRPTMNHAACDCLRRRFLTQLGAGFGTLAFEAMLHQQARAAASTSKSVIFIFLVGGPSQIDTFDFKPELQRLNGQPLPTSMAQAIGRTKFANVTH